MFPSLSKFGQRTVQRQYSHHPTRLGWGTQSQTREVAGQHHLAVSAIAFTRNQPDQARVAAFQIGVGLAVAEKPR